MRLLSLQIMMVMIAAYCAILIVLALVHSYFRFWGVTSSYIQIISTNKYIWSSWICGQSFSLELNSPIKSWTFASACVLELCSVCVLSFVHQCEHLWGTAERLFIRAEDFVRTVKKGFLPSFWIQIVMCTTFSDCNYIYYCAFYQFVSSFIH